MKKYLIPIFLMSVGLNLMLGFQNCAEVDPNFVFEGSGDLIKKLSSEPERILEVSNINLVKADLTRLQRSVRLDAEMEFRVKYSNEYIGLAPLIKDELELRLDDKVLTKLDAKSWVLSEKGCVESVSETTKSYFDCLYSFSLNQRLDIQPNQVSKGRYSLSFEGKEVPIHLEARGHHLITTSTSLALNFVDKFVPQQRSNVARQKATVPKVAKQKPVARPAARPANRRPVQAKKPTPKKVEVAKTDESLLEGVYCHIMVLNPPHLELLSDIKRVGSYYEDTHNCRDLAMRVSRSYCNRSLMGEIDVNFSIKDRSIGGAEKTLERYIESIECT